MREKEAPAAVTAEATTATPTTKIDPTSPSVKSLVGSDSEWVASLINSGITRVLSSRHFRVLLALRYHGAPGTEVSPGLNRLASLTGMSKRHVRRLLRELEDAGLILRLSTGGGRGKQGRYVLTAPRAAVPLHAVRVSTEHHRKTRTHPVRVSETGTDPVRVSEKGTYVVPVSPERARRADSGEPPNTETGTYSVRVSEKGTAGGPKRGQLVTPPERPEPAQGADPSQFQPAELSIELRKNTLPKGSGALIAHLHPPTHPNSTTPSNFSSPQQSPVHAQEDSLGAIRKTPPEEAYRGETSAGPSVHPQASCGSREVSLETEGSGGGRGSNGVVHAFLHESTLRPASSPRTGSPSRPAGRKKETDSRVNALRDIVAEELKKVGLPFGWSYERDGANAKRVLAQLDAQKEALGPISPLDAFRLAFQEFLDDKKASSVGFPLGWFWRGWDTYLRMAMKRRRHEMVDWKDVRW